MTDTLGKIKEFVNYVRHTLKGDEKGEDQFFYEASSKLLGIRDAGRREHRLSFGLSHQGSTQNLQT